MTGKCISFESDKSGGGKGLRKVEVVDSEQVVGEGRAGALHADEREDSWGKEKVEEQIKYGTGRVVGPMTQMWVWGKFSNCSRIEGARGGEKEGKKNAKPRRQGLHLVQRRLRGVQMRAIRLTKGVSFEREGEKDKRLICGERLAHIILSTQLDRRKTCEEKRRKGRRHAFLKNREQVREDWATRSCP